MRFRLRTLLVSIAAGAAVMALGMVLALGGGELLGPLIGHRRAVTVCQCFAVITGVAVAIYLGMAKSPH